MSGGNPGKSSDKRAAVRTEEDRRRKTAAVQSINSLFGTGEYKDRNDTDYFGRSSTDPNLRGRTKMVFGEDPEAYDSDRVEWEAGRDRNKKLREDLYAGNRNAVLDVNTNKLDRDLSNSERQLKFALGRTGLFAGSEDIAQHGKQREAYDSGVLQSTSLADQSAAGFRGADERTRLDIINQVESGVDAGTAIQNAQRGLELSAQSADANSKGNLIGNVFDDAGLIYQNYNRNQGTQDARNKYGNQTGAFFNSPTYSGTRR